MRKWSRPFRIFLCISSLLLSLVASAGPQASLRLVSARNHIEGGFLGNPAVYADDRRIYLASFTGDLFVLARDRAADFPVIEIVHDTNRALTAVRGDQRYIYVASGDGNLRVYRKGEPLLLLHTMPGCCGRDRHGRPVRLTPGSLADDLERGSATVDRPYGTG
jgi:hypothetical protein